MTRKSTGERQQEIIQAAMEIISEEGVQGLTMIKLANRIGLTDAALYKHFNSKKEILMAMINEIGNTLNTFITQQVSFYDDPLDKLKNILRLHLLYLEKNKGIPRILFSEDIHINDSDLKKRMYTMIKNYLDLIRGILYRAIQEKKVRPTLDIDATAIVFLGIIQGSIISWLISDFSYSVSGKFESLWNVFFNGL